MVETMKWIRLTLVLFMPLSVAASDAVAKVLFQNVCVQCHGAVGEGRVDVQSPSIAGLPAWYVLRQLQSFRSGLRGGEAHGAGGVLMAAAAKALPEEHLEPLAGFVESLPLQAASATKASQGADLAAGKLLYEERCMECHRYNATGEVVFGSPPLIGLQDWYLLAQIQHFKAGRRGVLPNDPNGAKMLFASQYVETDNDAKNVIAYLMTLNPKPQGLEVPVKEGTSPFDEAAADGD